MESEEDKILQKICFACSQYLYECEVGETHIKTCITNMSSKRDIQCKSCYCLIKIGNLYRHLNHKTVKCRSSYTTAEINALDKISKEFSAKSDQSQKMKEQFPNEHSKLRKCNVCKSKFANLLLHVTKNEHCNAGYGENGLKMLKEAAAADRRRYKTEWKQNQSSSEKMQDDNQTCGICNLDFKNIKHHLNQSPDCKKRYKEEELHALIKKIDKKIKESKLAYNDEYYKSHKKEKSYDSKLNYELFNKRSSEININHLESILTNKLKWKSSQCLNLKDPIITCLKDLQDDQNQEITKSMKSLVEDIQSAFESLKGDIIMAMTFLKESKGRFINDFMPNYEECQAIVKHLNVYISQIFELGHPILENVLENFKSSSEFDQENELKLIDHLRVKFQKSSKVFAEQYLQKFEFAKSDYGEKLSIWKLIKRSRDLDIAAVYNDLKKIQFNEVQKCLDTYSVWIPKYEMMIKDYSKAKGLSTREREEILDLEKNINGSLNECKEDIELFKLVFKDNKVDANMNDIGKAYKEFNHLVNWSNVLLERFEVLLRLELFRAIEVLSEFGHESSFTEEEKMLKFGLDPFQDSIGEDEPYLRQDEERELEKRRIDKTSKKYLKDFLERMK